MNSISFYYMRHNCPEYVFSGIMYNDKWEVSMAYVCELKTILWSVIAYKNIFVWNL